MRIFLFVIILLRVGLIDGLAQGDTVAFKIIAFYTARNDQAHISWVHEANRVLPVLGKRYHFQYDSTNDWANLNAGFLAKYRVVLFLDTRPEDAGQRAAFREYMEKGGGWVGFHFAAFALSPSDFNMDWDWYHNDFLGSGSYVSNTWRPTAAVLRVEDSVLPVTRGLPRTFRSSPNEWYRWERDLRKNPDIDILLSIDPVSYPLGTGPKPHEIWHSGYYPVVWTNKRYRMVYFNMGHNDIDYEHGTNRELSFTLDNEIQDRLLINAILWAGKANER